MKVGPSIALTLGLSVLGAGLGVWGSAHLMPRHEAPTALHQLIHEGLVLTPAQGRAIEAMERDHKVRRAALDDELLRANQELAAAYQATHSYSPQVQAAIDHFHHVMGEQQKETMVHMLAMRSVLTPEQARTFDQTLVGSLTKDPR